MVDNGWDVSCRRKRIGGGGRDRYERSLVSIAQTVTSTSSTSTSPSSRSNSSNNTSTTNGATTGAGANVALPVNMSANFSQHQRGILSCHTYTHGRAIIIDDVDDMMNDGITQISCTKFATNRVMTDGNIIMVVIMMPNRVALHMVMLMVVIDLLRRVMIKLLIDSSNGLSGINSHCYSYTSPHRHHHHQHVNASIHACINVSIIYHTHQW